MEADSHPQDHAATYRKIGISRPPLEVSDLPTSDDMSKIKRIGVEEMIHFALPMRLIKISANMMGLALSIFC